MASAYAKLLDSQKLQGNVAKLLGVEDEKDLANAVAYKWARENRLEDNAEDTLRHILLGGLLQNVPKTQGLYGEHGEDILGRMGKGIARQFIDRGPFGLGREGTDKESLIDIVNNNFGGKLREQYTSKEMFISAAKEAVKKLIENKKVEDIEGISPILSTVGVRPRALGGKKNEFQKGGINKRSLGGRLREGMHRQTPEMRSYVKGKEAQAEIWRDEEKNIIRKVTYDQVRKSGGSPTTAHLIAKHVVDFIPIVGEVTGWEDVNKNLQNKEYLDALINTTALAVGVIPGVGDVAGKTLKAGAKKLRKGLGSKKEADNLSNRKEANQALSFHKEKQEYHLKKKEDKPSPITFQSDIPKESWLDNQVAYVKSRGKDSFGHNFLGKVTGEFNENAQVMLPVEELRKIKGRRGEQENVREEDLNWLVDHMGKTGKLPLKDSKEYRPFITVDYAGIPTLSEGNHRIMAAYKLGIKELPVEIRYYDGGQRKAKGIFKPENILKKQRAAKSTKPFDENTASLEEIRAEYKVSQRQEVDPELAKGAKQIAEGEPGIKEQKIFGPNKNETWDELVHRKYPPTIMTEVPEPASIRRIEAVLGKKAEKGILGSTVKLVKLVGEKVSVRLDIPSYYNYNTWIPTIHKFKSRGTPGKVLAYAPAITIKNVVFHTPDLEKPVKKALAIAQGGQKNPYAGMEGIVVNRSVDDTYRLAQKQLADPKSEWIQIGMNPRGHSYFIDIATGQPVLEAKEVIQVGKLVLARGVIKGKSLDFKFQKGGTMVQEQINNDNEQMEMLGLVSEPTDVDPVSGNEIPLGATAEGVRDDEVASISPGEFVIPDYAVRYHGVDFYVKSLQTAQEGLKQLENMGLVGNPDQQKIPEETPLPRMDIEQEEGEDTVLSDTGEPMPRKDRTDTVLSDTGEPMPRPETNNQFQLGGIQLASPIQQTISPVPLPKAPVVQPIRPVSTQPLPTVDVSSPLGVNVSQYQQGFYKEVSPGQYKFFGPPGTTTSQQVYTQDQITNPALIAPENVKYTDVFGTQAGITPQSQYLKLQGEAAGLPGGYKIEPYINELGNVIYLTTVGGRVQGGTPPGYSKASPEDLGQTRRQVPTQAPVIQPRKQTVDEFGGGAEEAMTHGGGFTAPEYHTTGLGLAEDINDNDFADISDVSTMEEVSNLAAKASDFTPSSIPIGFGKAALSTLGSVLDAPKQAHYAAAQQIGMSKAGISNPQGIGNYQLASVFSPFANPQFVVSSHPTLTVDQVQAFEAVSWGVNPNDPNFNALNFEHNALGKVSGYKHDPKTFRSTTLMTTGGNASAGNASGGYAEDGSFVDSTGQASAMGTKDSFLALSDDQKWAVIDARAKEGRHQIHPNFHPSSKPPAGKPKTMDITPEVEPMTAQEAASKYGGGMDVAPTVTASETGEYGGIFKKGGLATKSKPKQKKSRRSKGLASL